MNWLLSLGNERKNRKKNAVQPEREYLKLMNLFARRCPAGLFGGKKVQIFYEPIVDTNSKANGRHWLD